jgi:hypothetical protein
LITYRNICIVLKPQRKKEIILLTDLVSAGAVHEGKSFARRRIDPLVSLMFIIHEEHRVVVVQD